MSKFRPIIYTPKGAALEYGDLAGNLYRGCSGGCLYCYVPQTLRMKREDFHRDVTPAPNALERLEHDCAKIKGQGRTIFLSFTCDPVGPLLLPAVEIIKASGNHVRLLTKRMIPPSVLDLLTPDDEVGVTLTTNGIYAWLWEPGCSPYRRVENLQEARYRSIPMWVSFEPVIDPEFVYYALRFLTNEGIRPRVAIGKANHLNTWNWPDEDWKRCVESIDWREFAAKASALCEEFGLRYTLKADLRKAAGL